MRAASPCDVWSIIIKYEWTNEWLSVVGRWCYDLHTRNNRKLINFLCFNFPTFISLWAPADRPTHTLTHMESSARPPNNFENYGIQNMRSDYTRCKLVYARRLYGVAVCECAIPLGMVFCFVVLSRKVKVRGQRICSATLNLTYFRWNYYYLFSRIDDGANLETLNIMMPCPLPTIVVRVNERTHAQSLA